jgi:hypothetical protein
MFILSKDELDFSEKAVDKSSSFMASKVEQSKKLSSVLCVSSINFLFFSLNLNISMLKISLIYGSKFCYNFFARIPQTLMDEIDIGIIGSTRSFLSKHTIPPKSPG